MPASLLTLLINLVPAASVLAFGWSAFTLLLLYWIENLIIGAINTVKIFVAGAINGKEGLRQGIGLAPFFVFHYGLFCMIHGMLIWSLFGDAETGTQDAELWTLPGLVIERVASDRFLFWNVMLLAAYHSLHFLIFWVANGSWRRADPFTQTFAPYGRVVVVHLTILIAGMPVALLGQPMIAVFVLALIKTAMETGVTQLGATLDEAQSQTVKMAREDFQRRWPPSKR